jgi:hypothetical protein
MASRIKWSLYIAALPVSFAIPIVAAIALTQDWLLSIPAVVLIGLTIQGAIGFALFRDSRLL